MTKCKSCKLEKEDCICGAPTLFKGEKTIIKAREYIKSCKDKYEIKKQNGIKKETGKVIVKIPTLAGLANVLEINKVTLTAWAKKSQQFSKVLDELRQKQEDVLLNKGLSGDYSSAIAKLILSARHDYREKQDFTTDGDKFEGVIKIIIKEPKK